MNYDFNKKKVSTLMKKYNKIADRYQRARTIREMIFSIVILSLFLVLANTFSQNQNPSSTTSIQSEKPTEQKINKDISQSSEKNKIDETATPTENTNITPTPETVKSSENIDTSNKTDINNAPENANVTKKVETQNFASLPQAEITSTPEDSIEKAVKMDEYYKNKLQSFDAFQNRQEELKLKEEELKRKEEELKILQSEVEKQISKYEKLKKEVEGLLVQVDAQHKKKITQLVSVYSGMKAEEAAKILAETDENTTIEILLGMDQKKSSKILENMPKEKAVTLSEKIADKK